MISRARWRTCSASSRMRHGTSRATGRSSHRSRPSCSARPEAIRMSGSEPEPPSVPEPARADAPSSAPPTQERPTPMLDVHPAHGAVSGWRDFLVHIAIIAIGLCLALGLEQTVEYLHHRHQVAETRRALLQEREDNRRAFAEQTRAWRRTVAELQNNLLVFEYLQQHPGTPQERLPGVLLWRVSALSFSTAAWDAARESEVVALMPRQELEQYTDLYGFLGREWDMAYQAVLAIVEAERYNLSDSDPSRLA